MKFVDNVTQASPDDPTVLIVNPHSRTGRERFEHVKQSLAGAMNLIHAVLPDSEDEFRSTIEHYCQKGARRFIIGGGDGTVSAAANVLAYRPVVIGVVPLGTGNTFFSGLNLPTSFSQLVEVLASGPVSAIDLGLAETETGHRYFLNTATLGVSERLTQLLTEESKKRLGWLAWPKGVRQAIMQTPVFQVRLEYRNLLDVFRTRQLIVANGRNLAGPVFMLDRASYQDRHLHGFSLGGKDWWSLFKVAGRLVLGQQISDRSAHYCVVKEVRVSTDPPMAIDIDGDVWEPAPCRFIAQPRALFVVARFNDKTNLNGLSAGKAVDTES